LIWLRTLKKDNPTNQCIRKILFDIIDRLESKNKVQKKLANPEVTQNIQKIQIMEEKCGLLKKSSIFASKIYRKQVK
jgi:hypothetical protein